MTRVRRIDQDTALDRACWFLWLATSALRAYDAAHAARMSRSLQIRLIGHSMAMARHSNDWAAFIKPGWPDRDARRERRALTRYWQVHGADDEEHFFECSGCARCNAIIDRMERFGRARLRLLAEEGDRLARLLTVGHA